MSAAWTMLVPAALVLKRQWPVARVRTAAIAPVMVADHRVRHGLEEFVFVAWRELCGCPEYLVAGVHDESGGVPHGFVIPIDSQRWLLRSFPGKSRSQTGCRSGVGFGSLNLH